MASHTHGVGDLDVDDLSDTVLVGLSTEDPVHLCLLSSGNEGSLALEVQLDGVPVVLLEKHLQGQQFGGEVLKKGRLAYARLKTLLELQCDRNLL